jgi:hypothetical protein
MPMVAQPLRELSTFAILLFVQTASSLWSIFCGSTQFTQWLYVHWHITAATVQYANELPVEAESSKIRQNLENQF